MKPGVFFLAAILIGLGWVLTTQPATMGANPAQLQTAGVTGSIGTGPASMLDFDLYGKTSAVVISGTFVYIGYNHQMLILDISQVDLPVIIGATDALGDVIADISVVGNMAYVASQPYGWASPQPNDGLYIIDLSDLASPAEIGFYPNGFIQDVEVDGDIAYVAASLDGLRAIDISDPSTPVSIGLFALPDPLDVAIVGTRAYVANGNYLVEAVDISDSSMLVSLGQFNVSGAARAISIAGDYAYVAEGYGCACLQIYNIANLAAPFELGHIYLPQDAYDVTLSGPYAYIADWEANLQIVDVSDRANPQVIGAYGPPLGVARDVAHSGNYAYLADGPRGLRIINVADPFHPFLAGFYDWGGDISAAVIPPQGGQFETWPDHVIYDFASGAFTDTVAIAHLTQYPGAVSSIGDLRRLICSCDSTNGVYDYGFFEVTATYSNTGQTAALALGQTYIMILRYGEIYKGTIIEDTLGLYAWNGVQWVKEPSSVVDITTNTITVTPNHFGLYAILGETNTMFLPATLKIH
jgi:hypothetical protein